jgi:hypothetical protein
MKNTIIALAMLSGGIAVAQVTPRNANPLGDVPPTGKLEPQPSKLSAADRTFLDKD